MPVRRKTYWRVSLGLGAVYFPDEEDARDYAKDRAADPENWDGIPFVEEIDEREMITRINTLEASNQ
jgi:hypothetical protein